MKIIPFCYVHLTQNHRTTQKGREEERERDSSFQISGGIQADGETSL